MRSDFASLAESRPGAATPVAWLFLFLVEFLNGFLDVFGGFGVVGFLMVLKCFKCF